MNQDFLAWAGQGPVTDRTQEHLGPSDRGIIMIRKRFFEEMKRIADGGEAKGLIRDPDRNRCVELPMMDRESVLQSYTKAEIMADPRMRMMFTTYVFQAGQPDWVKQEFAEAMGLEVTEFSGLRGARQSAVADA